MKKQIQGEKLAPYLPWDLNVMLPKGYIEEGQVNIMRLSGLSVHPVMGWIKNMTFEDGEGKIYSSVNMKEPCMPIFRPLADLNKTIIADAIELNPIKFLEENGFAPAGLEFDERNETFIFGGSLMCSVQQARFNVIQKLFEWHFDVFDGIRRGWAIPIYDKRIAFIKDQYLPRT